MQLCLISQRPNAIYTHRHFVYGVANAAHQDKSIGKVANTTRSKFKDVHGSPTDEWFRLKIKGVLFENMNEIFFKSVAAIIERIKTANPELYREWKRNGMVVGIDMHKQQRYDKTPKDAKTDEDIDNWMSDRYLNKTKYEKGTILCNTFATISCITKKSSFFGETLW